jgi:hypothetical protein
MKKGRENVIFIGLDVDDKAFHGCAINQRTGENQGFKTKPSVGQLVKRLKKLSETVAELKICYEATYLGYTLQRGAIADTQEGRETGQNGSIR